MNSILRLAAVACGFLAGASQLPGVSIWTGAAGDGQWTSAANWSPGVPVNSATPLDTAAFDGSGPGGTLTWPSTSSRPKNVHIAFKAGAPSYALNGDYFDNAAGNLTLTTEAGMVNAQTVKNIKVGTFTWTLNGTGPVTITQGLQNSNGWVNNQVNSATFQINPASAVLTLGGFAQTKRYNTTKTGSGSLVLTGTVDWTFGLNAGAFVSGNYTASAGTIDVSGATLKLEDNSGGTALQSGQTYTIVNFAGATLSGGANFAGFIDVPSGWEVVVDTPNNRIALREIPLPPATTVVAIH